MRANALTRAWLTGLLGIACLSGAHAAGCNITGGWVSFGAYDPRAIAPLDTAGTLALDCNGNVDAGLSLSVGVGTGASYSGGRRMTQIGGPATLIYNIYADPARALVLGDGTDGSRILRIVGKKDLSQIIYARIPALQRSVQAGIYGDIVIATISY
ncbi:MAG: spore coat U domain-containing protein [Burkholderiaceae bacterium]|nr:spore coat U domain-containing protein [Burkholderiaceae bacterium]